MSVHKRNEIVTDFVRRGLAAQRAVDQAIEKITPHRYRRLRRIERKPWTSPELIHTLSRELEDTHNIAQSMIAPVMKIIEYEHPVIGRVCRYCGEVDHLEHEACPVRLLEIVVAKVKWGLP